MYVPTHPTVHRTVLTFMRTALSPGSLAVETPCRQKAKGTAARGWWRPPRFWPGMMQRRNQYTPVQPQDSGSLSLTLNRKRGALQPDFPSTPLACPFTSRAHTIPSARCNLLLFATQRCCMLWWATSGSRRRHGSNWSGDRRLRPTSARFVLL